ncbi:hypothetical protein [Luethyella okanaganae]|uniref:DUF5134 domain-containing protein n=1 Tax=Luethyella okanaganae TaxID=69372 RepID=A0ABW1VE94_9MICO
MVILSPIGLLAVAELIFFIAASVWFATRVAGAVTGSNASERTLMVSNHIHSMSMMAAMSAMAFRSMTMEHSDLPLGPQVAHHSLVVATASQSATTWGVLLLVITEVVFAAAAVVSFGVALPRSGGRSGWRHGTMWGIGILESLGTIVLIMAMLWH